MEIRYFEDTDTLHFEFRAGAAAETHDLDDNTLVDLDTSGQVLSITIEHAQARAVLPTFSYEQIAA